MRTPPAGPSQPADDGEAVDHGEAVHHGEVVDHHERRRGLEGRRPIQPRGLVDVIERMPKAELHLHLDGSLRAETALELARTRRVEAPATLAAMRATLQAPPRGADQAALLWAFDVPIALLQDGEALERATTELVLDKAADGVQYVEIRWGPRLHLARGLSLADGIAAVCRGARAGSAAVTANGSSITVRLICTAIRSHDPDDNVALAKTAGRFRDEGLTGWDLAGPEAAYPDPLRHAAAFAAARESGVRITLHAGEWGGPAQVWRALELEPERIAHGAVAADDPRLVTELIARAVVLDLCPTSNVQAGVVTSIARHPLARLHRAGVLVTLSTDDLTVSGVSLSEEYRRAVTDNGLTLAELWAIDRRALDAAFADEGALRPLRAAFDGWRETVAGDHVLAGAGESDRSPGESNRSPGGADRSPGESDRSPGGAHRSPGGADH